MKIASLFLLACTLSFSAIAQRTIQIRNLWAEPQVHVVFEGYVVSFTIKDINRALVLLAETGDVSFDTTSRLDPSKQYNVELFSGYRTEYRNRLQPLLQKGVGAFLLTKGHAVVENSKRKKLKNIEVDIQPRLEGVNVYNVKFYDPNTSKLIFNGEMAIELYNKDLGIE